MGVTERVPHPDGRIKAMRLTAKGEEPWRSRGRSGPRPRPKSQRVKAEGMG